MYEGEKKKEEFTYTFCNSFWWGIALLPLHYFHSPHMHTTHIIHTKSRGTLMYLNEMEGKVEKKDREWKTEFGEHMMSELAERHKQPAKFNSNRWKPKPPGVRMMKKRKRWKREKKQQQQQRKERKWRKRSKCGQTLWMCKVTLSWRSIYKLNKFKHAHRTNKF